MVESFQKSTVSLIIAFQTVDCFQTSDQDSPISLGEEKAVEEISPQALVKSTNQEVKPYENESLNVSN